MKWNRFTLKTKTEAEDIVICTLAEVGIEGVEIQDKQLCGYRRGNHHRIPDRGQGLDQ